MSRKVGGARASRIGALGFTFLALVLTGLTALLLARMMGDSKYADEPVQQVVVAATTINASEVINETHLKVVKWPQSSVPAGAFKSLDEILGPDPRVPVSTLFEGEPVIAQRLANPEKGTGMAAQVPKELRAFPVPIDNWIADARLVYPGAVVDVLSTIRNSLERKVSTKLVLQRIRVLAVDGLLDSAALADPKKKSNTGGGQKSVVTLLVTPEQAEMLALASREGKIDLMLRNAGDPGTVETLGITPPELLGEADPEEVAEAQAELAASEKAAAAASRARRRPRRSRVVRPEREEPRGPRVERRGNTKTITIGGE